MSNISWNPKIDAPHRQCKVCKCYCTFYDLQFSPVPCTCIKCATTRKEVYGSI